MFISKKTLQNLKVLKMLVFERFLMQPGRLTPLQSIMATHRFLRVVGAWLLCFDGPRGVSINWHLGTLSTMSVITRGNFEA